MQSNLTVGLWSDRNWLDVEEILRTRFPDLKERIEA